MVTLNPSIRMVSSMVSLVVPGTSLTIALWWPQSVFINVDLPTLGSPVMARVAPSLILQATLVSFKRDKKALFMLSILVERAFL